MPFAVIRSGGKQYIVKPGDKITVEKLDGDIKTPVRFEALMIADGQGGVQLGKPTLSATVTGTITNQFRDKKISVVKFKSKVRYRRRVGHRQPYTTVQIEKI